MFDVLIIGAGLTGTTLALALKNTALKIGIIDSNLIQEQMLNDVKHSIQNINNPDKIKDLRSIALSHISMKIFTGLGLWDELEAVPIKKIHVSDRGNFGFTRFDAKQYRVPALGYVVPIPQLMQCLLPKIVAQNNIEMILPTKISAINYGKDHVEIITHSKTVTTKLLVIADGGQSNSRELLGFTANKHDYQQAAIVANIGLRHEHEFIAYERFTQQGPLALLPLAKNCSALVWTHRSEEVNRMMNLNDIEFLAELQRAFGHRLGKFAWVGRRQHFPLYLMHIKQKINKRCILLGNACHTLHPIAGQGFNLSLRDVAVLAEKLSECCQDLNRKSVDTLLQNYIQARENDQRTMINLTDTLVKLFSNNHQPLALLRNIGLLGLDLGIGKNLLAAKTMGYIYPMVDIAL